ncbi:amino acid permease [Marssonina coronariae]|uniref:Amino acid permease n=1 Tax=Diplocarpon coronariae TaxID=2795749 RepID=A0A218YUM2_9HELO|nr:amino acid permease [Marssonina coronariae]
MAGTITLFQNSEPNARTTNDFWSDVWRLRVIGDENSARSLDLRTTSGHVLSKKMQGCDSLQRSAIKSTDINMNNVDAPMISFAFDEQEMRMPGRSQQLNLCNHPSPRLQACGSDEQTRPTTGSFGLVSGGTAGLVWGYLVGAGYMLVFATIAEMASIAKSPTSGGHYVVGRRTSLAHRFALELTENRLDVYPGMAIWPGIVGLLGRSDDAKVSWSWIARLMLSRDGTAHSSQLPSLFGMVFNTFLVRRLPQVEGMVLVVHFLGFFAVLIPLWVLAPLNSPRVVFMEFLNLGAWDSKGLSFLVGLLAPIHALIGVDSAVRILY